MKKWIFSILLTVMMGLALLPNTKVFATGSEGETTFVAQIGSNVYNTLDAAVAAAVDGDTITVLVDCETAGLNLSKDLTIKGASGVNPTITFNTYGMALWANVDLVFEDCTVVMNNITSTPYTGEWNWMAICASSGVTLTLDNVDMSIVCTESNTAHCIYFCSNNKLNLNNSTLLIQGYNQDALEWDGGDGGYNVNITNSTYISESNRSGFTGTFYATIDNSTVEVNNSSGNGSNGTYYTIKNNSYVEFNSNGSWGISAWRIDMTNNSTLIACDNAYSGVWTRVLNVDSTCTLDVERNGAKSTGYTTNAGIFFQGNGTYKSTIEAGAKVTIKDNAGCGIYTNQSVCNLTINTDAVITNNGTGAVDANGHGAKYGGGVYNVGTMVLCDDVIIYNNHADVAGDDIYSNGTKSITFGDVNSNATWVLDDCDDMIDGWYEDGYETVTVESEDGTSEETDPQRWSANCESEGYVYTELRESGTYTATAIAFKAAHAVISDKTSEPGLNKTIVTEDGDTTDSSTSNAGDTIDYKLSSIIPSTLSEYINYTYDEDSSTAVGEVHYTTGEDEEGTEIKTYDEYVLIFHDDMPDAMTLNDNSIKVYIGDEKLDDLYYSVNTSNTECCNFELSLDLLKLYTEGIIDESDFGLTSIVVTYTVTLSEEATAGTYTNTAWVSYLDKTSEKDTANVDVYGVSVFKYDQSDVTGTDEEGNSVYAGLKGAEFTLYKAITVETAEDNESDISAIAEDDEESTAPDVKNTTPVLSELNDETLYENVTLTSDSNGYVTFNGLAAGTYYLVETKAPNGYVKADTVLEIVIPLDADGDTNLVYVEFANAPIPSTGGMGTTPFKAVGMSLLLAAGVVYAFTLRRKKEEA